MKKIAVLVLCLLLALTLSGCAMMGTLLENFERMAGIPAQTEAPAEATVEPTAEPEATQVPAYQPGEDIQLPIGP